MRLERKSKRLLLAVSFCALTQQAPRGLGPINAIVCVCVCVISSCSPQECSCSKKSTTTLNAPDSFWNHQPFVYLFIYFIVSGKFVSCQLAPGTSGEA